MSGPPTDVPASELFLKLQEMPRPSEVIEFPRRTATGKSVGTIRIMVLANEDHDLARIAGRKVVKEKHKLTDAELQDAITSHVVGDAIARELLAMACRTEENFGDERKPSYPRIFPDGQTIGQLLSGDEVNALLTAYRAVQHKWGPFEGTIQTEEELSLWIKRLVEGAAEFPLKHLSSAHLEELPLLLAVRAYTLSVILDSLFSILPDTLKSSLRNYSLGTGYFGKPAATTPESGTGSSVVLKVSEKPITLEDAKRLAIELDSRPAITEEIEALFSDIER